MREEQSIFHRSDPCRAALTEGSLQCLPSLPQTSVFHSADLWRLWRTVRLWIAGSTPGQYRCQSDRLPFVRVFRQSGTPPGTVNWRTRPQLLTVIQASPTPGPPPWPSLHSWQGYVCGIDFECPAVNFTFPILSQDTAWKSRLFLKGVWDNESDRTVPMTWAFGLLKWLKTVLWQGAVCGDRKFVWRVPKILWADLYMAINIYWKNRFAS